MKIIAFSKYLSYMVGGAEKSTIEILKQKSSQNYDISLISFDNINSFGAKDKFCKFNKRWDLNYIKDIFLFKKFFYWEYFFNKNKILNYFTSLNNDAILYTYAMYAPLAILGFNGECKLFIRSESDLGINTNYHQGIKRYLKYIYMALEYPAFYIYKKDLKKAIQKADIICNSNYMANRLKELYNKKSEVIYPFVDIQELQNEYDKIKNNIEKKGIVFVGDSINKGINIVLKIALKLPNEIFYIFSRYIKEKTIKNNIIWMPWQKNEADIYKYAKIVIVPSIWEEAYGRVSHEAFILNIDVLVSNIGGLKESVNETKKYIIDDYKNIDEWVRRIEKFS